MTGGLIQLVLAGKQDIYLTINPEITFFRKIFKKYVNFACEFKNILPDQSTSYNNNITFTLNKIGDALYRCYLEVDLPYLIFSDSYITNQDYINQKKLNIINLDTNYSLWYNLYENLKGFVDIEIILYRKLIKYLQTENITLTLLQNEVSKFNYTFKISKDLYKNKIDNKIYIIIDISGYINNINLLITNDVIYDSTKYINRTFIINNITNMYSNMVNYLDYYNYKLNYYLNQKKIKQNNSQINFNFSKYLGHHFFENISLEIGGVEIDKYSNEILHIQQLHHINNEYIDNYYKMIGHDESLYSFNTNGKGGTKIIIPLIFWFCKDSGNSLPLVALNNTSVIINVKINNIEKIISFQNFEKIYDDLLNINIDYTNSIILNTKLLYTSYNINIKYKYINYKCIYINNELIKLHFNALSDSDINYLLTTYGTSYTNNEITHMLKPNLTNIEIQLLNGINGNNINYIINKNQWIYFMTNISTISNNNIKKIIGSYYPYIDFNIYYSIIQNPNIQLIGEFIYLDDIERQKYAKSKLEYIVETFYEDIYNINSLTPSFNCELSLCKPCKELIWFIKPQIFIDGLYKYGPNLEFLYNYDYYFINNIIDSQSIILNQLDLLFTNVNNNYYTYFLSYKYLNNILPYGIYYQSFSLYPEETQPSGTINLKELKLKQYNIIFNPLFINEYNNNIINPYNKNLILKFIYKSYNLFVIHLGTAKMVFNY
jgi:hypothetical protein